MLVNGKSAPGPTGMGGFKAEVGATDCMRP